jgi:hypothetical protein
MSKSKTIYLVVGGFIGALLGVLTALIINKQVADLKEPLKLSPGQGVKVGMGVVNLLRSIFEIGKQ